MSSISSSFIEEINTKHEAWRLINDPSRLFILLYSKYGDIEEDLYLLFANQIIFNLPTKLNCVYKELKYTYIKGDYLKRNYKIDESIIRIPKLSDYYKNYHLFFCRPTLRHYKLGKIMCNFQDKKAEIFYKNNYELSKDNIFIDKEYNNNFKKNDSLSLTSFDNITNNKIIFDKYTKKMLDKSETDLKNNNYYNTLILETSRSNNLNNNGLISKRTEDTDSFEKCIHALVEYQYNKNKKLKIKNGKKPYLKNKKINIRINTDNNSGNQYQMKSNIIQSHHSTNQSYNFKIYNQQGKLFNKYIKINSNNNSYLNNNNEINKIIKTKKKKKSLYSLIKERYNTSSGTLIGLKINNMNNNLNYNTSKNLKEININYPITTTHKDSKKKKVINFQNNNDNNGNFARFAKFTEYLNQSHKKQENSLIHKKNCLSISNTENTNLYFNISNNKKNRITKKKVKINKNLKINTTNLSTQNLQKSKHAKNKTFDYNTINNSKNYLKTDNIIFTEEFNASNKKNPKKQLYRIDKENNNYQKKNNPLIQNKNIKGKIELVSQNSNKLFNKISVTQTTSKEKFSKMRVRKIIPLNINSTKKNNNIQSPHHKKNNKSLIIGDNINKFNISKSIIGLHKNSFFLSPHKFGCNKFNLNNIASNLSPTNRFFNNLVYIKTNISHNMNSNRNIYIKKSINKDNNNLINHKKVNSLMNSFNNNNTNFKEISTNLSTSKNNYTNKTKNMTINSENKKFTRNKKINLKAKFNCSKQNNINSKTNPIITNNNNDNLNYQFIINNELKNNLINNNGNINISIGKNNINIKDSILHIDKIYIKKENNKIQNNTVKKTFGNEKEYHRKKPIEIKVEQNKIKIGEKINKQKKDKLKIIEHFSKNQNNSSNLINVHRNFNLINNNKNYKEGKRKFN